VLAVIAAGGPAGIVTTLSATMPPEYLDPFGGRAGFAFLGFALGIAAIGLGALGQPHLLARLMAVKDEGARRQGFIVAMSWAVIVFVGMASLAFAGRALLPEVANGEALFYQLAAQLLPAVLAGIVIAAVLSAVMSTVDSLLVAASAAAAHDLRIVKLLKGREVLVSRTVMSVICALAVVLTLTLPATIFDRVLFSWSALGAAFGPVIVARVMKVEPQGWAIFAAILAGFFTTVLFYIFGQMDAAALTGLPACWPTWRPFRAIRLSGSRLGWPRFSSFSSSVCQKEKLHDCFQFRPHRRLRRCRRHGAWLHSRTFRRRSRAG
jgi:Na+/proline symporter